VGISEHGDDQTPLRGNGDAHVHISVDLDLIPLQTRIDFGVFDESLTDSLDQDIVQRNAYPFRFPVPRFSSRKRTASVMSASKTCVTLGAVCQLKAILSATTFLTPLRGTFFDTTSGKA